MRPTLQGVRARPAILAFALAAGALLSYQAARLWLADHRIRSTRLEIIERGVALEPGNAEAWDLLGRHRQLDFANADPQQELADYQRAVQDDPLSATFWMNLAGAYEANGDLSSAQNAFERARAVYPLSAEVAWNYGNFLLRQEKDAEGYAEIHHAVQSDPKLLTLAISRVWRSSHDVNVLLDQVLPPDVDAYIQALDFFASIRQSDAALAVWRRLISLQKPVALPRTFPFFDELILDDRSADAKQVWIEALAAAGLPHEEPLNHSLVWNGGFSARFRQWRAGMAVELSHGTWRSISTPLLPSAGVRAVRLDFGGGSNLEIHATHAICSGRTAPDLPFSCLHADRRDHHRKRNALFDCRPQSQRRGECANRKFYGLSPVDRHGYGCDHRRRNALSAGAIAARCAAAYLKTS